MPIRLCRCGAIQVLVEKPIMKKATIAVGAVIMAGTVGIVLAQPNRPPLQINEGETETRNIRPLSPEDIAKDRKEGRLLYSAMKALNAGNYSKAEADARRSVALGPGSGFETETLASALYSQGRDREALQVYKSIYDARGEFPRNLLPYALLSLKARHWAQAASAYDKALPHLGDGDLMRRQGGFSPDAPQSEKLEAAIHIGMGLTMDGGDFHGTYQDRNVQGLIHFQRALALEPNSALTNYYYGYGLRRLNRHAEAQAAFQQAAALDHGGPMKAAAETALRQRH